ncbi:MAG: hypothetical protein KGJ13_05300 [Patescibacteria group bacterium]|nr:hypothetical protein [Patescibacteria group bacterium]
METLLIMILVVLVIIVFEVSRTKSTPNELREIATRVGNIEARILDVDFNISSIKNDVQSIENAVRASVSGWMDEYEIKAESSRRSPVKISSSKPKADK